MISVHRGNSHRRGSVVCRSYAVFAFLTLDDYGFFIAVFFGHIVAPFVGNYLTFLVITWLAVRNDLLVVHLDATLNLLRIAAQLVDVFLDLLLLRALFHLTVPLLVITAFILVNYSRDGFLDIVAGPLISRIAALHVDGPRLSKAFSLQSLLTILACSRRGLVVTLSIVATAAVIADLIAGVIARGGTSYSLAVVAIHPDFRLADPVLDDSGLFITVALGHGRANLAGRGGVDEPVYGVTNWRCKMRWHKVFFFYQGIK